MSDNLIDRLHDEADLCRNEGADDIANLLDEAIKALASRTSIAGRIPDGVLCVVPEGLVLRACRALYAAGEAVPDALDAHDELYEHTSGSVTAEGMRQEAGTGATIEDAVESAVRGIGT